MCKYSQDLIQQIKQLFVLNNVISIAFLTYMYYETCHSNMELDYIRYTNIYMA